MGTGRARLAASILDADFGNLGYEVRRVVKNGADRIHLDVMDGHFVPNLTFGPKTIRALRRRTEAPFDAHLMIEEPLVPTLRAIKAKGRAAGLAVKPATPLSAIEPYRELIDIVLVMTVEPGFGGQAFMREPAQKILPARQLLTHRPVAGEVHVDGGINRETAEFVGGLGADILVVGSALWIKGHDQAREIRLVKSLADEGYQYNLNDGVPPIPRDNWVRFTSLPKPIATRFRRRIEAGGIPVIMLRGDGQMNPDGLRDYDLLVPASAEALTIERHAAERDERLAEAETWRAAYLAEHPEGAEIMAADARARTGR